jgi:hypothetical protein
VCFSAAKGSLLDLFQQHWCFGYKSGENYLNVSFYNGLIYGLGNNFSYFSIMINILAVSSSQTLNE